nr:hypothetical protein [Tanacetum cinerariifolium]
PRADFAASLHRRDCGRCYGRSPDPGRSPAAVCPRGENAARRPVPDAAQAHPAPRPRRAAQRPRHRPRRTGALCRRT